MEIEKKLIAEHMHNDELNYRILLDGLDELICTKDTSLAIKYKNKGNKLFIKKKHTKKEHQKIWKFYTICIATALNNSEELAIGYANRSALLDHFKKYEECLLDIDKALRITKLNSLKVKLFCRKSKCKFFLQEDNPRNCIEKAKYWLNKIDTKTDKNTLIKIIQNTENILEKNSDSYKKYNKKYEIKCISSNAFTISYNESDGRCLIATRNIKAGQFIHMENFYATCVKRQKSFAYCSHCLSVSWTTIPCLNCSNVMYCSENCREIAWKKYHDIECYLKLIVYFSNQYYLQIALKCVIMGIKEAGGIKNLKLLINSMDKSKDKINKDIEKNEIFDSFNFKHLYSMNSGEYNINELYTLNTPRYNKNQIFIYTNQAFFATYCLFKSKNFDKYGEKFNNVTNIVGDDNIAFIGALLLRFILIVSKNSNLVLNPDHMCKKKSHPLQCSCFRGMSLSPFGSLINHSCSNNVERIITNDGKVMYFSLNPIKKNSQLFLNYFLNYVEEEKSNRQNKMYHLFGFICQCIACQKNWLHVNTPKLSDLMNTRASFLLQNNVQFIQDLLDFNRYNEKSADNFKKDSELLFKNTLQPSFAYDVLILTVRALFYKQYCKKIRIPICKD